MSARRKYPNPGAVKKILSNHPIKKLQAADRLIARARELLKTKGWGQSRMITSEGCFCFIGALRASCPSPDAGKADFDLEWYVNGDDNFGKNEAYGVAVEAIVTSLSIRFPGSLESRVISFNDAIERRRRDIFAVIDRTRRHIAGAIELRREA